MPLESEMERIADNYPADTITGSREWDESTGDHLAAVFWPHGRVIEFKLRAAFLKHALVETDSSMLGSDVRSKDEAHA